MMTLTSILRSSATSTTAGRGAVFAALLAVSAIAAAAADNPPLRQPVAGDTYVYRVINAYNNEPRGQLSYRVDKAESDRIVMSVTADKPGLQITPTEIVTTGGQWLRHPIVNHDQMVDYEFSPAYPSYEYPLEPGKEWSVRVNAVNPETGARRSVRVDAQVVGSERIRVPAGEFDTVKIRRMVYAGDADNYWRLTETTISEMEWYAPALGRTVRIARSSGYMDLSRGHLNRGIRGDWDITELVSAPPAR
jgi:hypothetical protein